MKKESLSPGFFAAVIFVYVLLSGFFIYFRSLTYDDGVYLYAAREVFSGRLPYLDFAYPQGPLLIYVYGLIGKIFGYNLYVSRIFSCLLGLGCLLLTARTAALRGGADSGKLAAFLLLTSLYTISHYAVPQIYALTSLLLLLAIFFAASGLKEECKVPLVMACSCLAAGIRLSLMPLIIISAGFLFFTSKNKKLTAVLIAGVALVILILLYGPYILADPRALRYHILGRHLFSMSIYFKIFKPVFILSENCYNFPFLVFSFLLVTIYFAGELRWKRRRPEIFREQSFELYLIVIVVVTGLVHLLPRGAGYIGSYYNNLISAVVCILAAIGFANLLSKNSLSRSFLWKAAAAMLIVNLGLSFNVILKYKIISHEESKRFFTPPIKRLQEAAHYLEGLMGKDDEIMTFSTYLAVQMDRKVPPGMENGLVSYTVSSSWEREKCERLHMLNTDILAGYLAARRTKVAAFTDNEFWTLRVNTTQKRLGQLLKQNYRLVKVFPEFGQYYNNLYVYVAR